MNQRKLLLFFIAANGLWLIPATFHAATERWHIWRALSANVQWYQSQYALQSTAPPTDTPENMPVHIHPSGELSHRLNDVHHLARYHHLQTINFYAAEHATYPADNPEATLTETRATFILDGHLGDLHAFLDALAQPPQMFHLLRVQIETADPYRLWLQLALFTAPA